MTTVKLTGADSNVFNIINLVVKALKRDGKATEAFEFTHKAFNAASYDAVLQLAMTYCDVE